MSRIKIVGWVSAVFVWAVACGILFSPPLSYFLAGVVGFAVGWHVGKNVNW